MTVLHSVASAEWGTPQWLADIARETMGGIDLDPASCAAANETIKASRWIGVHKDGIIADWCGARRVICNAPSGRTTPEQRLYVPGARTLSQAFWRRCHEHVHGEHAEAGRTAFWIGYSLNSLANHTPAAIGLSSVCMLRKRVQWTALDGASKKSPPHYSWVALITQCPEMAWRFTRLMRPYGAVHQEVF